MSSELNDILEVNEDKQDNEGKQNNEVSSYKNSIANIIKVMGFCTIVAGFIGGLIMEKALGQWSYTFEFGFALPYWIGGFISGMLFIGLSEIINLLQKIYNKQ